MNITIKHDRDDKGWIFVREGQFSSSSAVVFDKLYDACVAARATYPEPENKFFLDERKHRKLSSGFVMLMDDEEDLQEVEFI